VAALRNVRAALTDLRWRRGPLPTSPPRKRAREREHGRGERMRRNRLPWR
jgi:hypothetical protein